MTAPSVAAPRRPRVLLVGPMPNAGTPIGGTQVSFAELVRECRASGQLETEVLDTSRPFYGLSPARRALVDARTLVSVVLGIAWRARDADVILFNASSGAVMRVGPLIWAAARLRRTPLAVRIFGGCFDLFHEEAPAWSRALVERTVLDAPLVLLQTNGLCAEFGAHPSVRWLPTTRRMPAEVAPPRAQCRRFLFLSQLRPEKGIAEALSASDRLPVGATLSVFGPPMPGTDAALFARHPRARYEGVAAPEDVQSILAAHDALVFPTYHVGEGLPGVVVEALQQGRPVIASTWRALPELVEHEVSGLLVAPRSVDALSAAMNRLAGDDALFANLCGGALARGREFASAPWHARLESWLVALARGEHVAHYDTNASTCLPPAQPRAETPAPPGLAPHERHFENKVA
jgi:glycosyltransferase involved in cell wall biosynthesis